MKVGLDGRYLGLRRGVGNLAHSLINALQRLSDAPELYVYVPADSVDQVPEACGRVRLRTLPRAPYAVWEQVLVPRAAKTDGVDVLHSLANTGPFTLPREIKHVVTIHDAMFMLPASTFGRSPATYQRLGRLYRRGVVPRIARRAACVITVSQHSRIDISRLMGLAEDRLHVVTEAAGPHFRVLPTKEAHDALPSGVRWELPYVLALGATDPRKNTVLVLEAFARFREAGFATHRLVIAGLDHRSEATVAALANDLNILSHTKVLGFIPEHQLIALYNTAQMFLYPSLYEGFGLPVLEAMACGAPVIASSTTSVPEVAGSAALLVQPDLEGIVSAMMLIAGSESKRRELRERGIFRAGQFSWNRAAAETLNVYEAALRA